jgi:hypothetical protein
MKTSTHSVSIFLFSFLTLQIYTHAVIIYNKALATTAGGTAAVASSTPYATGYEPNWAIDGVLTFCNSGGTACPGPYLNQMYKSLTAMTADDVFLRIDMGGI